MAKGKGWIGVLGLTVLAFLSPFLFSAPGSSGVLVVWIQFLVQPALWASAGLAAYLLARRAGLRISLSLYLCGAAFAIGLVQVGTGVLAGIFTHHFGHSPYSHEPLGLLLNTWYIAALIAGRELARWYVASRFKVRGNTFALLATWLLFTVLSLSPLAWRAFLQPASAFDYLGVALFPALGTSLLATYLVLRGGPLPAIAYTLVLAAFEWYPPVLPQLFWPVQAAIGSILPLLALAVLDSLQPVDSADSTADGGRGAGDEKAALADVSAAAEKPEAKTSAKRGSVDVSWIALGAIVLFAVWLNTGIFGYKPVLIDGISMQPTLYAGDVVLTGPTSVAQLQVGDVIRFREGNVDVLHRIKAIDRSGAAPVFTTRGDHNPADDPPVAAGAVEGKMLFGIPAVGKPVIIIRRLLGSAA